MATGVVAFLAFVVSTLALTSAMSLDTVATKELEEAIKKDTFVISLQHIKAKRRYRTETLFSIDFPNTENKFLLILDRKTKRVTVETVEEGHKRTQHFTVDTLHEDSIIKSLILSINQTQPGAHGTLYIDCVSYGMVATPKSMRDMFTSMNNPRVHVFHEKRYTLKIDGVKDVRTVLSRNECPLPSTTYDKFDDGNFENDLKDDPNIQAQQPDYNTPYRGDIPLCSVLDDDSVLNSLNQLITAVNILVKKTEQQSQVIDNMRRLLEDCEVCKVRPQPQIQPSCATHPPSCFPGVRCHDTPEGPRCGACPRGYIGNGYDCTPGRTCAENPCFPGVECRDTARGAQCGHCPSGYEGNGETCRRINHCQYNPCAPGCAPVWRPRQ